MTKFEIFPDDSFITSFPKSGNTWVRFFIAQIIKNDIDVNLINLDNIVPDIYKVDAELLSKLSRPRYLKSHHPFMPAYPRVLYLVRDVRGVVSSFYRQRIRMGKIPADLPIAEFTRMFIDGKTSNFPTWDAHVKSWISGKADSSQFLMVRYEDLLTRGPEEFGKILQFLQLPRTRGQIEAACERCTFDRMRKLENEAGRQWREKTFATDISVPFMFSGLSDSWKTDLDGTSKKLLNDHYGHLLTKLGYEI